MTVNVHDNSCSIDFDYFDFSVKALHTRIEILRSNSDVDFYILDQSTPLASPSSPLVTSSS
jgi:hypothetical protein